MKALNKNQLFLLRHIPRYEKYSSLTSLLRDICQEHQKALSTLKDNAQHLKDIGLIDYGTKHNPEPVKLTEHGKTLLLILDQEQKSEKSKRKKGDRDE